MNVKTLMEIPPWEWPEGSAEMLLEVLQDRSADPADRVVAAELAGDVTVINDGLVAALLSILPRADESPDLRGAAAIALGPVLDDADIYEFDDPDELPITEETFHTIQESLRALYTDPGVPKDVRRRVLEASVRAPQDWHEGAVRAAYSSDDEAWKLTAVFCMRFIRGFDAQILESLDSDNPEIEFEAVCAAGEAAVDAAWPHIHEILMSPDTDKPLRLAAIEAAGSLDAPDALELLIELADDDDEDIVEAAHDALIMSGALAELDDDDDEDDDDDDR